MKKALLIAIFGLFFAGSSFAQLLFTEDFTGFTNGTVIGQSGWTQGAGTTFPSVSDAAPLTYAGYNGGGSSYMTMPSFVATPASRVFKTFSPTGVVATGNVYYMSYLVNFSSVVANSVAYTVALGDAAGSSANLCPKLYAKAGVAAGTFNLGVSKQSTTLANIAYGTTDFNLNTTYLVVVKYVFHTLGAGHDDELYAWVNPDLSTEPSTATAECKNDGTVLIADLDFDNYQTPAGGIGSFVWNSRGVTAPVGAIDGIRVAYGTSSADAWTALAPALSTPVELTSFAASVSNGVKLSWSTATETNNKGFEVERKSANSSWTKVGFVQGKGTTTSAQNYSFSDKVQNGNYSYRLKQVDFDGTSTLSKVVTVEVNNVVTSYSLDQNYPNPFNPSTTISFSVAKAGNVSLKVYNLIGQEVRTLVNGMMEAGNHTVSFNAAGLNSGMYFYKLETENFSQVRKMTLMK